MAPTTGTIAAISSPPGPGLRGVIRISGPLARGIVRTTARIDGLPPSLETRGIWPARFHDGRGEQPALLAWMPAPHSYTREDVAELHLPGSGPLLRAALERVLALGAEPAQPGAFTRRAFENGRLDLTRAEGVLALVQSANEAERRSAAALLFGGLETRIEELRSALVDLRALCEASLDFDERDTGHVGAAELAGRAEGALRQLEEALLWEERREPLAGLPRVVLAGAPNAGKSTLFNRLSGSRALVSEHAGTTRDPLRGVWHLAGVDCLLFDTAGLAEASAQRSVSEPDRIAQELGLAERRSADLLLWVVDGQRAEAVAPAELAPANSAGAGARQIRVWTKLDLPLARERLARHPELGVVAVSGLTGEGLETLARAAALELGLAPDRAVTGPLSPGAGSGLGRELGLRHRRALVVSRGDLERALELLGTGAPLDLVAETLRAATDALDEITGRTSPEDLLDRIFSRFCLGK
jgi:tRNA modification GTPase